MKKRDITRRRFLQGTAAFGGMVALGWPSRFSWAVETPAAVKPLRIVYYTDIHARVEWGTPEAMRMAAEAMNAHKADLVLCGGDMITDGYQSSARMVAPRWDAYRKMHDAIKPRPIFVLGNHDIVGVEPADGTPPSKDVRADVREKMGITDTYGSFDHSGYHFILLDCVEVTDDDKKYRGYIGSTQIAWLKNDLASVDAATPIVVVCHMPLLTGFYQLTGGIESPVPSNRGVVNNREVLTAFEQHNLLLVLQGHLHVNEMMRWRETTFITGGAVCGKWWRGNWYGTDEGYGVLNLQPGRVDWEYCTYGWKSRRPSNA